jgi:hypothetical protein
MEAVLVTVGRDHDMTNKRIRLPKDGAVKSAPAVGADDYQGKGDDYQGKGDDYQGKGDVEGHGLGEPDKNVKSAAAVGAEDYQGKGDDYQGKGDDYQGKGDDYQGKGDVEGHAFVNPAPPADFSKPGPSSGGESVHNHEDADASD